MGAVLSSLDKKPRAAFAMSRLWKQWPSIVGEVLAAQTQPKKIERNTLWVAVENGALHYELSLMRPAILQKIQETHGTRFKDIKLVNEPIQKIAKSSEKSPGKKFEKTEVDLNEDLQKILQRVKSLSLDLQKTRKK